ncbi:MAG: dipeptide epimerase [Planctomycetes bacterium]|nr:dipeptide epimerase [Planctomycetota bacterium]
MIDLAVRHFALPLRHPFTISRGTVTVQDTVIVQLHEGGCFGYGEATTNPYYGATVESLSRRMLAVTPLLRAVSADDLDGMLAAIGSALGADTFARSALDMAAHDLWARRQGQPLHRLWGLDPAVGPASNYTIGIDTPERMVRKLAEVPEWPIYKIKLGTDRDLEIIRELRNHTDKPFRVDANCGWTTRQAIEFSGPLAELGVEFIEQPLAADDPGMAEVRRHSALPVFADESCGVEGDVEACAGLFHGINIKLCKCGGLAPARRMIARARELGLDVMCGCMTESTVGISALAQIVPQLDFVDMDGAALLASDIASGVVVEGGLRRYPDRPGTGVELQDGPLPLA